MPTAITIFAASDLVFITAGMAVVVLALRLWPRSRLQLLGWVIAAGLVLLLSFGLAQLGGALFNDARPFTTSHVPPLIAHAPDNGFPSDHALLAAAVVALVALADPVWALPFVVLAVLIDWARVGAGIHHVADVVGSSVFVALAASIALAVAPAVVRWAAPWLPAGWRERRLLPLRER